MPRRTPASFIPLLAASALVVVLLGLAILQYRWSTQIADAEGSRLRSHMREAVRDLRIDSYGELARIAAAFEQAPPDWKRYAERYALWSQSSLNAEMLRAVYLWEPAAPLQQADRATARLHPTATPPEFAPLLARLSSQLSDYHRGQSVPFDWSLDEELPALIHPVLRPATSHDSPQFAGFLILQLSPDPFFHGVFAERARRHLRDVDGIPFLAALVLGNHTLYQSDPAATPAALASPDTRVALLDPIPDEVFGQPLSASAPSVPRIQPLGPAHWQLLVKHRAGSVRSLAEGLRRRNLAVSFAALLLLALATAGLIVSTQRARRLARLQVDFVAGVSHELRTPLTVICSAGQNLADGLITESSQVARYGVVVRDEGRRLTAMIEQILAFARRQAVTPSELAPIPLRPLVEEILSTLRLDAELHLPEDLPAPLAEPAALRQCLRNLLSNAAKYAGPSPWISLRARSTGASIEIDVEDHGPGIDPADLPHIFEPFYRGRYARDAQIRGFGLGLSLAQESARAMGGKITVKSAPGKGSCFTLHLPAEGRRHA